MATDVQSASFDSARAEANCGAKAKSLTQIAASRSQAIGAVPDSTWPDVDGPAKQIERGRLALIGALATVRALLDVHENDGEGFGCTRPLDGDLYVGIAMLVDRALGELAIYTRADCWGERVTRLQAVRDLAWHGSLQDDEHLLSTASLHLLDGELSHALQWSDNLSSELTRQLEAA